MLFRLFFVLCTLCSVSLSARLEDHFKRAPHKGKGHQIRNIDFIYMINLDRRPEKFESSLKQLQPYGMKPYPFSAVNGWELTLKDINDVGLKIQKRDADRAHGTGLPDERRGLSS